ncbi:MAG: amidohydrolase [Anaerolineaceae bacterium]|nr:amidohydrolase [Anaerolineaceae bacterium]
MLILHNARIPRLGSINKTYEAIAIQNGIIAAIGNDEEVLSLAVRKSEIINMHGKTIFPGFTDSHIHLQHLGKSLSMVDCETFEIKDCYDRLLEKTKSSKPGNWILGHGWNQNQWAGGFENIHLLNQITDENPIYITAKSLHAAWANKKALEFAGINQATQDPIGGFLGRNSDGALNGLLFESAMGLMDNFIPALSKQELVDVLNLTQQELWKIGITSVHDFDGSDCFSALQKLDTEDKLRMRVVKNIPVSSFEAAIQCGLQSGFGSDYLRIGSVKLFADGALGPQTAAMIQPYETDERNFGFLLLSKDEIIHYGKEATKNGLSLAIHAIGDKANEIVIDAFADIRLFENENRLSNKNHRIEHVQILAHADLPRLAENQIIASMQPIHLISDMETADRLWGNRSRFAYAFNSLLQFGTLLVFGSDSPVESFNPFFGIYAALTRKKFDQTPINGWYPEENIQLSEILKAYTINPAVISKWDNKIGSLEIGKNADLIILSENPFELSPSEIKETLPIATMVAGNLVWQGNEL